MLRREKISGTNQGRREEFETVNAGWNLPVGPVRSAFVGFAIQKWRWQNPIDISNVVVH